MSEINLRPAEPKDFPIIVQLNADAVQWTSPMNLERLNQLHQWSDYHRVVTVDDQVAAFLLVMAATTDYDSTNYIWFKQNYERFLYIDRIVVAPPYAGQQLGSRLYQNLFVYAKTQGVPYITCEYNVVPMNLPSKKFHDRFGFKQVGSQWLDEGKKQVSMQVAEVNT